MLDIRLDATKLLGFRLLQDASLPVAGPKAGAKIGGKSGTNMGAKIGAKIGVKPIIDVRS